MPRSISSLSITKGLRNFASQAAWAHERHATSLRLNDESSPCLIDARHLYEDARSGGILPRPAGLMVSHLRCGETLYPNLNRGRPFQFQVAEFILYLLNWLRAEVRLQLLL